MYTITPISPSMTPLPAIYDPRNPGLRIRSGTCTQEVNGTGGLDFVVDNNHPSYADIRIQAGLVDVGDDSGVMWRGHITTVDKDMNLAKHVHAEGVLGMLNGSFAPPFVYPDDYISTPAYQQAAASGNVVRHFLGVLLGWHNANAQPWQQLTLGEVTVTDPNNYIGRRRTQYSKLWDVVKETTFNSALGGYLMVRYGTGTDRKTYVDYLAELPDDPGQKVEFASNLIDLLSVDDASELYTAVLPLGANGLTIASLPNGTVETGIVKYGEVVYNDPAGIDHGVVIKIMRWDDVTVAQNLLQRAVTEARLAGIARTVQAKAIDLYASGSGSFRAGRRINLDSGPYGIRAGLNLTKVSTNLLEPSATVVTFGAALPTISAQAARNTT